LDPKIEFVVRELGHQVDDFIVEILGVELIPDQDVRSPPAYVLQYFLRAVPVNQEVGIADIDGIHGGTVKNQIQVALDPRHGVITHRAPAAQVQ